MCGSPASSKRAIERWRLRQAAFLLVAAVWLVQAEAAAAEPGEAVRWLQRVSEAARTLNYEGVFVYQHKGGLEAMRIIHRADDQGETERLYSLTGAAREIIRDDQQVTCILPDSRSVLVDRRRVANPLIQLVPKNVDSLSRNYALEVAGEGRVAGRPATRIGITPRDEFRFGYHLWIDQQTGLLLQADVFDGSGAPFEQLMFTQLHTPETISAAMLQPQSVGDGFSWYRDEALPVSESSESDWTFDDLPPGFELVLHELRRMPGSDRPVEHLLFSDGLANVSVYIEKTTLDHAFSGHSEMGAVKAYGRLLDQAIQITAVGEVPAVTVERIGESIRPGG